MYYGMLALDCTAALLPIRLRTLTVQNLTPIDRVEGSRDSTSYICSP